MQCPKCKTRIRIRRIFFHSRWHPIRCDKCHEEYFLDFQNLFKIAGPTFLAILMAFFADYGFPKEGIFRIVQVVMYGMSLFLAGIFLIQLFISCKNLKSKSVIYRDRHE